MLGYQEGAVERWAKGLTLPRRSLLGEGIADQGASASTSCSVAGAFVRWW